MSDLVLERFPEFFEAASDHEPFEWQYELTRRLIEDKYPGVIDVPTGLGKTSVIHCWAFALAARTQSGYRPSPLRLSFVVDRRLVVDSAFTDASNLARALAEHSTGVVRSVADSLTSIHGTTAEPLTVVRMRGGVTWESRWLARPDQAAVVVGTVDQFGSRLLFRGYGVSASMRPINAALVGLDAWLVVDEAHIAGPLTETVGRVALHQSAVGPMAARALRTTHMSATVTATDDTFRAELDRQTNSTRFSRAAANAQARIAQAKPVALVDLAHLETGTRKQWRRNSSQLGVAIADLARSIDEAAQVVGVVANTISTARAAHQRLESKGEQAILLIGRVRGYERDKIQANWVPTIEVGAERAANQRLFVVATQTIEVGANLDLDALVTECAPLASIVQRFGRVNRLGAHPAYRSLIVHAGFAHDEDVVYGTATANTWEFLRERAGGAGVVENAGKVVAEMPETPLDLGLRSVRRLAEEADEAGANVLPSEPFVPLVIGAHLERWAATNPAPSPDQEVAPFLHGVDRYVPEVSVGWRAEPPEPNDPESWSAWLDLVPPVEWEMVPIPIWEVKTFLSHAASDLPVADLEVAAVQPAEGEADAEGDVMGAVYRGLGESVRLVRGPRDVRPGERLVLRSDLGGHDEWGWTGFEDTARAVPDVGDLAPTRRRRVLRLSEAALATWSEDDSILASLHEAFGFLDTDDSESHPDRKEVTDALLALSRTSLPDDIRRLISSASEKSWTSHVTHLKEGRRRVVLLSEPVERGGASESSSDDDTTSTSQTSNRTTLDDHCRAVGDTAREFGENLGLDDELVRAVGLAGSWHDLGKADERFQLALHDGDRLAAAVAPALLAKSGRDSRDPAARRARAVARLPRGFRHEAVSARLVDDMLGRDSTLVDGADLELVRHLVVSHHGKARPLLPPLVDSRAPHVSVMVGDHELSVAGALHQLDWAQPYRFEALNARYGWWGLALLETVVRLADMLCSEEGR